MKIKIGFTLSTIKFRLVFFCFMALVASSIVSAQQNKDALKSARKAFDQGNYWLAIRNYDTYLETNGNDAAGIFELGKCYLLTGQFPEGLEYITRSLELKPNVSDEAAYWMGLAYHKNYDFKKAIETFENYKNSVVEIPDHLQDIDRLIDQCNYGIIYVSNPKPYKIENLGPSINTQYAEHSPAFSKRGDILYYVSAKHNPKDFTDYTEEEIKVLQKSFAGTWRNVNTLTSGLDNHIASLELFEDDKKMLFCELGDGGNIYYKEKMQDGSWSLPKTFFDISSSHEEADAFISPDGETLYISSSRDSDGGNLDILVCKKEGDGIWSAPKPMAAPVNSKYNEHAPVVSEDGTMMYFSSDREGSMGGYDIFMSYQMEDGSWSKPENLGFPVNTPGDDIYFHFTTMNQWEGFISSNRPGGYGGLDIYEVKYQPDIHVKGQVVDAGYNVPLLNITLKFQPVGSGNRFERKVGSDGYDVSLKANSDYVVKIYNTVGNLLEIDTLHFPHSVMSSPGAVYEHDFKVEMYSSPGAVTSVVETKEREEEQVSSPAAPEEENKVMEEEVEYNEEEILVTEDEAIDEPVEVKTEEPKIEKRDAFKMDEQQQNVVDIKDIRTGCKGVLHNVYFPFNGSQPTPESYPELDQLACLMNEMPELIIEIGGHTDAIGNALYNKQLSQQRARAVVDYIIDKGVDPSRLKAVGYGEEQPMATNDDELEGRELNRRTEYIVLEGPVIELYTEHGME